MAEGVRHPRTAAVIGARREPAAPEPGRRGPRLDAEIPENNARPTEVVVDPPCGALNWRTLPVGAEVRGKAWSPRPDGRFRLGHPAMAESNGIVAG